MNILHPDTGDILDRITILHLKLAHADEPHWRDELEECYKKLEGWSLPPRVLAQILALMATNARIWQLGDELEAAEKMVGEASGIDALKSGPHLHRLGMAQREYARAWKLNQNRAGLVTLLNGSLGMGAKREKV